MRFTVTSDWRRNELLQLILLLFLVFVASFCVVNALLFINQLGFSYQSVVAHYLGKAGPWGAPPVPRSYKVLLEVTHGHLFAMAILAMTMTHLALFVPAPLKLKLVLIVTTFGAAFANEGSGWLIRYVSPRFAYLKLVTFCLLEVSLLAIVVLLLVAIVGKRRNAYSDGARPVAPPSSSEA